MSTTSASPWAEPSNVCRPSSSMPTICAAMVAEVSPRADLALDEPPAGLGHVDAGGVEQGVAFADRLEVAGPLGGLAIDRFLVGQDDAVHDVELPVAGQSATGEITGADDAREGLQAV